MSFLRMSASRSMSARVRPRTAAAGSDVGGRGAIVERLNLTLDDSASPLTTTTATLKGLTVAVKDSYDIAGLKTGNGSPAWLDSHPVARSTAPAVNKLLKAGATVLYKTVMDEMAYSIEGHNHHYGIPLNPASSDRLPGGSSSGSASAVAQGLVDIGLGGDTGGSVRIPASFCGLFGIRPTHGRVNISGSVPLAPSFDTGGWMTRDATLLEKVGSVLLEGPSVPLPTPARWLVSTDAFDLCSEDVATRLYQPVSNAMDKLLEVMSAPSETVVCDKGSLFDWFDVFRVCQAHEVWQVHGDWVRRTQPAFGPGIKERFDMASKITDEEFERMNRRRGEIAARVDELLAGSVLMIPTASGPAPRKCGLSDDDLQRFRATTLALTSIAGLGGLPQVTMPVVGGGDEAPLGLSLLGPRGSDEALLACVKKISDGFRPALDDVT